MLSLISHAHIVRAFDGAWNVFELGKGKYEIYYKQ